MNYVWKVDVYDKYGWREDKFFDNELEAKQWSWSFLKAKIEKIPLSHFPVFVVSNFSSPANSPGDED